jgi:ATP-dependent Lhr-like helicase
MELSGEVIAGYFFTDIPGPQFASPAAVRLLGDARPANSIFWINATDPISLCGAGLINSKLPRRISSNHLVYHGNDLVMVSERLGKSLLINVPADDARLVEYLEILRHLQQRPFKPVRKLVIESINEQPVTESPYLAALETFFEVVRDYKTVYLQRDLI